ncbi:hypothetical protein WMY93_016959 [Mugilogobius chulae]|uniref:Uncharacterized protein n=1 Tax=Mugilogobius chulae TaxID=88201 RepID=A0AAW0NXV5_9GOBI
MKMVKAQGNCMARCSKVTDKKQKNSRSRSIAQIKKLKKRRNVEVGKRRRKGPKVRRKSGLKCRVKLKRLDTPKKENGSARVKQTNKCCHPRLEQQAIHEADEPKMNHSSLLKLSLEPRRRRMASLNAEAVNSLLLFREDPLSSKKTQQSKDYNKAQAKSRVTKPKMQQNMDHKHTSSPQDQNIDWLSIFAPTPRRQAGLTAATLLKLTSTQYRSKRQKKREANHETEGTTQSKTHQKPDHKSFTQHTKQPKTKGKRKPQSCSVSSAQTLKPELSLKNCVKDVQQDPTAPYFSPQVKEEKVSSCYCCTQEQCVQYCHRLALFLRDKSFQGQGSMFHHHHHHHHFQALGTHSYTCFPGYYFHLCHPSDTSQDHVYLSSRKQTKLMGIQSSGATEMSHPVYCCTSVEPCFDPCTVSSYRSYPSVMPAICHMGCTKCNYTIKQEEYPATVSDMHSRPSHPMCPSPTIPNGCPVSPVPPAGQSVHNQALPSEPRPPAAPLPLGRNCSQIAKASRDSHMDSIPIRNRKYTPSGIRGALSGTIKAPMDGDQLDCPFRRWCSLWMWRRLW